MYVIIVVCFFVIHAIMLYIAVCVELECTCLFAGFEEYDYHMSNMGVGSGVQVVVAQHTSP